MKTSLFIAVVSFTAISFAIKEIIEVFSAVIAVTEMFLEFLRIIVINIAKRCHRCNSYFVNEYYCK